MDVVVRPDIWKTRIEALLNKGMSQAAIAKRTGCSPAYISLIKDGKRGDGLSHKLAMSIIELCKDLGIE